jgi:hypothetical protein
LQGQEVDPAALTAAKDEYASWAAQSAMLEKCAAAVFTVQIIAVHNVNEIEFVLPLELQDLDRNKCQGLSGFFLQHLFNGSSLLDGTDLLTMCSSECSGLFENLLQMSVTTCSQAWNSSA